jgi:hypothetical protein
MTARSIPFGATANRERRRAAPAFSIGFSIEAQEPAATSANEESLV